MRTFLPPFATGLNIVHRNCRLDGATLIPEMSRPFYVLAEELPSEKRRAAGFEPENPTAPETSRPSATNPRSSRNVCLFGTAKPQAIERLHSVLRSQPDRYWGYRIMMISKSEFGLHMSAISAAKFPRDGVHWIRMVAREMT